MRCTKWILFVFFQGMYVNTGSKTAFHKSNLLNELDYIVHILARSSVGEEVSRLKTSST